ncbi:MAG: hypothetical protein M3290_06580 [Actinomycetota bacterium]|nr:hypothetical protein [Actinomycetota bacterium]
MSIEKTLADLNQKLVQAQADLKIVEEQLLYQMDVVEETKTRALVAETPLAEREYRIARDDCARLQQQREEGLKTIADLKSEQDRLLDRMLTS